MKRELHVFEEGPEVEIDLESLRAVLEKYRTDKRLSMVT